MKIEANVKITIFLKGELPAMKNSDFGDPYFPYSPAYIVDCDGIAEDLFELMSNSEYSDSLDDVWAEEC